MILFVASSTLVSAQVGRVEVTMDTVPVGGEEQREKMSRMEAHDRLTNELIQLRDSVHAFTSAAQNSAFSESMTASEEQLSEMIKQFKRSEGNAVLFQKGTDLLDQTRREFHTVTRGQSKDR
jgi:hypothetical protein